MKNIRPLLLGLSLLGLSLTGCNSVEETKYGFCDPVTVGNFSYTLNNASNTKQVGSQYLGDETNDNFVIINLTVKNVGSSEQNLLTGMMLLHMGKSVYEPHSSGIYLDDGFYVLQSIGAGITKNINVLYETPNEYSPDDYLEVKASTYSSDSEKVYLTGTPYVPHVHSYNDEWQYDEDGHWRVCTGCGALSEKVAHSNKIDTIEPTFERDGYISYTCTICGFAYSEKYSNKLNHNYSNEWSYDSEKHWHSCIDAGYSSLTKDEENHSMTETVVQPTFESKGYTLHSCSKCNYSFKDNYVDELQHSYSNEWSYDSEKHWHSCTDQGYQNEKADISVHRMSGWDVVTAATDTTDGLERRDCEVCEYYETRIIDSNLSKSLASMDIQNCNTYLAIRSVSPSAPERFIIPDEINGIPITLISASAFKNKTSIKSIKFGSNIENISNNAFEGCTSLENVEFNDGLTLINKEAFAGCVSINSIAIPNSVRWIYAEAFKDCSNLESVIINGSNLDEIYPSSFSGCESLKYNKSSGGLFLGNSENNYSVFIKPENSETKSVIIPEGCNKIALTSLKNQKGIEKLSIPSTINSMPIEMLSGCSNLVELQIPFIGTKINTFEVFGVIFGTKQFENSIKINLGLGPSGSSERDYYAPANLKKVIVLGGEIKDNCFSYCTKLKEIEFLGSPTYVGDSSFSGCSSLITFVIPDSVTTIKRNGFQNCTSLECIVLGTNLQTIDGSAFWQDYKLIQIVNKSSQILQLGKGVATYARYITNTLEKSRIQHREDGYSIYSDGESVVLLNVIDDKEELAIPSDVTEIVTGALSNSCAKTIRFGDNVQVCDTSVFPNTVEKLYWDNDVCSGVKGEYDIYSSPITSCYRLKEIIIGDNVKTLKMGVFSGGSYSPANALNSFVLPVNVTEIEEGVFFGWYDLAAVLYKGSEEQFNDISLNTKGNSSFVNATKYFYSENEPTSGGNYWHYENGVATIWYV